MMTKLFLSLVKFIFGIISTIISAILTILPLDFFPNLSDVSNVFSQFWDIVFGVFDWFRACLLIPSSSLIILLDIIIVKYTIKPVITGIKILLNWIKTPGK